MQKVKKTPECVPGKLKYVQLIDVIFYKIMRNPFICVQKDYRRMQNPPKECKFEDLMI